LKKNGEKNIRGENWTERGVIKDMVITYAIAKQFKMKVSIVNVVIKVIEYVNKKESPYYKRKRGEKVEPKFCAHAMVGLHSHVSFGT
jgi:hypothetical protein